MQPKLNGEVLTSAPAADGQAQFQFVVSEKMPALAEAVEGTLLLADLPRIVPTTFELAQWKRAAARAGRNNLIYVDNKCPHPLLLEPTASGASDGRWLDGRGHGGGGGTFTEQGVLYLGEHDRAGKAQLGQLGPPATLQPNEQVLFGSEATSGMGAAAGAIVYRGASDRGLVGSAKLAWRVPFMGERQASGRGSGGMPLHVRTEATETELGRQVAGMNAAVDGFIHELRFTIRLLGEVLASLPPEAHGGPTRYKFRWVGLGRGEDRWETLLPPGGEGGADSSADSGIVALVKAYQRRKRRA